MTVLVVLLGVAIVCFGLAGLSAPQRIVDGMLNWQPLSRFYFAVGSRLSFGTVLLMAASDCRFSTAILVLGVVALVAWSHLVRDESIQCSNGGWIGL